MKKFMRNLILAFLLCACMLALTGCPSKVSKEMTNFKEEMVTTATYELTEWFSANIPSASLKANSLRAHSEKSHLFDAVTGVYTDNGKDYSFLYSLGKRRLFVLDERMDNVGSTVLGELLDELLDGYSRTNYLVKTEHCGVHTVIPSVDKGKLSSREIGNTASEIQYNGLPYEASVDDILDQAENEFEFRVNIYLEIEFSGLDSLDDLNISTVRQQGVDPEKPTVWLTALAERKYYFSIDLYNKDKSERIEFDGGPDTFTSTYSKLEPKSKDYAEIETIRYSIDRDKKTVARESD